MAKVSVLVSAATAITLLSTPAALAQVIPLDPLGPDAVTFQSLDDPGYRVILPISPSVQADCWRLNENWSFNFGVRYEEEASVELPDGIYTVTVDAGDCQGSGTFAHTGRSWFAMLPGPHDGGGDSGETGEGDSN